MTTEYGRVTNAEKELIWAMNKNDVAKVQDILERNASSQSLNINCFYDTEQTTPLIFASINNINHYIVHKLLRHGADPNRSLIPTRWTALHYACKRMNIQIIETLSKFNNTNVNLQDVNGITPLHLLLSYNMGDKNNEQYVKCIQLLLDKHGIINVQDKNDMACLFHAIELVSNKGQQEENKKKQLDNICQLLLNSKNVDVTFQLLRNYGGCIKGDTVLHCAVRTNHIEIVNLILEKFSTPINNLLSIRNSKQETAYDIAQQYDNNEGLIIKSLKGELLVQIHIFLRKQWIPMKTTTVLIMKDDDNIIQSRKRQRQNNEE